MDRGKKKPASVLEAGSLLSFKLLMGNALARISTRWADHALSAGGAGEFSVKSVRRKFLPGC